MSCCLSAPPVSTPPEPALHAVSFLTTVARFLPCRVVVVEVVAVVVVAGVGSYQQDTGEAAEISARCDCRREKSAHAQRHHSVSRCSSNSSIALPLPANGPYTLLECSLFDSETQTTPRHIYIYVYQGLTRYSACSSSTSEGCLLPSGPARVPAERRQIGPVMLSASSACSSVPNSTQHKPCAPL